MDERVWYAAYGSNLLYERFLCYVRGGRPEGALRTCGGCRDGSDPAGDEPYVLDLPLTFAGQSPTWGGGVAVVTHPADPPARTLGRLYLITPEQLADVAAQERQLEHADVDLSRVVAAGSETFASGRYGTVVFCGQHKGIPVFTLGGERGRPPGPATSPTPAYVRTMARGLAETHALSPETIVDYLAGLPVLRTWSAAALAEAVTEPGSWPARG